MSPTQRTLAHARKLGYLCAITERWNVYAKIRQDLYGFIDVLAFDKDNIIAIQTTSGSNHAARVEKILASPIAMAWLVQVNRKIEVWSWAKQGPRGKRKTWVLRREPVLRPVNYIHWSDPVVDSPVATVTKP